MVAPPAPQSSNMKYYLIGGGLALTALGIAAYFILSKPAQVTSTIGSEMVYDSGVLNL